MESLARPLSRSQIDFRTLSLAGTLLCCFLLSSTAEAQWPNLTRAPRKSSATSPNLASPAATLKTFSAAVKAEDWVNEFLCYSHSLRSRFSYLLIRSMDELSGEHDLMEKVQTIIAEHSIPDEAFTNYPSMRSSHAQFTAEQHQAELKRRLEKWREEVYPQIKDWPKLIQQLQPLLLENYNRHSNDVTHPSQSGIVPHLRFHYYAPAFDLLLSKDKAEASIVAIVRDPTWQPMEQAPSDLSNNQNTFSDRLMLKLMKFIEGPNIRRPKEQTFLIREENQWRIDAVPYR